MIAFVQQERPTFCFLACLESFLAENRVFVSQREILKRALHVLGANPNDLGGFSNANWKAMEDEFGLEVSLAAAGSSLVRPKESIFVICQWEGRADSIHWVRLLGADASFVYLMNPAWEHCPQKLEVAKFSPWWKILYRVRTK